MAGDKLKGHIQLLSGYSKPQRIELRLSCSFLGGTLVNPSLPVKRMNAASFVVNTNNQIEFEYQLPPDIPASSVRIISGINHGVTCKLSARVVESGVLSRSLYACTVLKVGRRDSGSGIKVKFVKFGGEPFRELLSSSVDCR